MSTRPTVMTGKPCHAGHLSPRYTDKHGKPAGCVECHRIRGKENYQKNKDAYRARAKTNREKAKLKALSDAEAASRRLARNSWSGARARCNNPNNPRYSDYGGRGIRVSEAWARFEAFLLDMGHPEPGQTLDRIDVNGDYSPENCRWIGRKEQNDNRRNTVRLVYEGASKTLKEWSRDLGVPYHSLKWRAKQGWPSWRCLGLEKQEDQPCLKS